MEDFIVTQEMLDLMKQLPKDVSIMDACVALEDKFGALSTVQLNAIFEAWFKLQESKV